MFSPLPPTLLPFAHRCNSQSLGIVCVCVRMCVTTFMEDGGDFSLHAPGIDLLWNSPCGAWCVLEKGPADLAIQRRQGHVRLCVQGTNFCGRVNGYTHTSVAGSGPNCRLDEHITWTRLGLLTLLKEEKYLGVFRARKKSFIHEYSFKLFSYQNIYMMSWVIQKLTKIFLLQVENK